MRVAISAAATVLLVANAAWAGEARVAKLVQFRTQARVEVDSAGKVVAVTPDPALPAAVGSAIRNTVAGWRFAPPTKDGRAVSGVTFLYLGACAVPEGENFRFAVSYRGSGPAHSGPSAPAFPFGAMRPGHSLKLKLSYTVLADGTARVEEIVFPKGDRGADADKPAFRRSLQEWVKASKFEPEQLDGRPVATRMSHPIEFKLGTTGTFNSAQRDGEKEAQRSAAAQPSCQTALAATKDDERPVALDSPFQLLPPG